MLTPECCCLAFSDLKEGFWVWLSSFYAKQVYETAILQKLAGMNLKIRFCDFAKFHDVASSAFLIRSSEVR